MRAESAPDKNCASCSNRRVDAINTHPINLPREDKHAVHEAFWRATTVLIVSAACAGAHGVLYLVSREVVAVAADQWALEAITFEKKGRWRF